MDDWLQYHTFSGPFCRCCGSRNLVTLDTVIAGESDLERSNQLRLERLWLAVGGLGDHQMDMLAQDMAQCVDTDYPDEIEHPLSKFLSDYAVRPGSRLSDHVDKEPVSPKEIESGRTGNLERERKRAFKALWESFDPDSRSRFLNWAQITSGTGDVQC